MTKETKILAEQAAKLPPAERVVLVEEILASIPEVDSEWEAAWANEARQRIAAYERGEASAADFDEAMSRLKARHLGG